MSKRGVDYQPVDQQEFLENIEVRRFVLFLESWIDKALTSIF